MFVASVVVTEPSDHTIYWNKHRKDEEDYRNKRRGSPTKGANNRNNVTEANKRVTNTIASHFRSTTSLKHEKKNNGDQVAGCGKNADAASITEMGKCICRRDH